MWFRIAINCECMFVAYLYVLLPYSLICYVYVLVSLCYIAYDVVWFICVCIVTSYACSHYLVKCFSRYKRRMLVWNSLLLIILLYIAIRYVFGLNIAYWICFGFVFPCGISSSLVDEMYIVYFVFGNFSGRTTQGRCCRNFPWFQALEKFWKF